SSRRRPIRATASPGTKPPRARWMMTTPHSDGGPAYERARSGAPRGRRDVTPRRSRLDVEMTRRGLAESRESAQRLIMAGRVRVNSRPAAKPDLKVDTAVPIAIIPGAHEYASRGAYKLIAALDHFGLTVTGRY